MKNYCNKNTDDAKTFITNYEIKDNQIIVHLASGKNYSVPYTQDNEEKILTSMKRQIYNKKSFFEAIKKCIVNVKNILTIIMCISCFFILLSLPLTTLPAIVTLTAIGLLTPGLIFIKKKKKLLKDYEKQNFFLDNEKELNDANEKDPNVLANVSKKTKEIISSVPSEKPKFTLNTIHKMKYQDLKEIIENIQIIEALGYDYQNIEEEIKTEDQKRYSK